ncbi:MAG TPA: MerR family transcriptional regulator [Propionibacteriaceae bacterium]|nr:MerR family transcriptional regulator [Propionibacteriaceae bacterium]
MYTIKRASEMVGVPVATLRAWQRRYGVVNPDRSASGYRLYGADDIAVLRRMQALVASGWSPKEAAAAAAAAEGDKTELTDLPRDEPRSRSARRAGTAPLDLVAAAVALDPAAITRLLDDHFAKGSFEQVVDRWLLPELERLGQAWADGVVSVAGEHLAAAGVQRRLSAAFDAAAIDSGRSPLLLTGLPRGCRHELGILAFATAARRQGLAVVYLGPDLPLRDWLTAADRHQPDAVVIAVPTLSDVAPALEIVKGFAGRQELIGIGGRHQEAVLQGAGRLGGRSAVPLGQSIAAAAAQLRDRLGPL